MASFSQLAHKATTAESVRGLTSAIYCITNGATQSTKDAFATPPIVASFSQLAHKATTAESVRGLTTCDMQHHERGDSVNKRCIRDSSNCGVVLSACPQSDHSGIGWVADRCHIQDHSRGVSVNKKMHSRLLQIVASFCQLAVNATTAESVGFLATAISNITNGATQSTKDAFAAPAILDALRSLFPVVVSSSASRMALVAALAAVSPDAVSGFSGDHFGIDCVLKQALIVFPPDYFPPCDAREAIERCGLSGVTNLPLIAKDAAAIAAKPPGEPSSSCCRWGAPAALSWTSPPPLRRTHTTWASLRQTVLVWARTTSTAALNAALRQRAHDGTGLLQLKPILCYLFRGLEALLPAKDRVVYRGVPSSCIDVVREKYQTGKDVYWTSFASASEKINAAIQFASKEGPNGVIFRIVSLTGRYVKWYSSMPHEGEVIFSPNSSFTVSQGPHDEMLNGRTMCVVNLTERRQESVVY